MLKNNSQMKLSEYSNLYDIVVPSTHLLRKIKENIDFSFVNEMLKKSYCENFGRPAKEPEMMFKLLFLKKLYDLSDEVLIDNVSVNMAYKYFLDMNPEESSVDPSLLTKFRKMRITDEILEDMLQETVKQAIRKGLIKSRAILIDATHIKSKARAESPTQVLRELTKSLRKEMYRTQFEATDKFPEKPSTTETLDKEVEYSKALLENVKKNVSINGTSRAKKLIKQLEDLLEDEKIKSVKSCVDKDARFGYKTSDQSFFGYKAHLAMTEEYIITGVQVTSGEKTDGSELEPLLEQSLESGIKVEEIIADKAYSSQKNLSITKENDIKLISRLSALVMKGTGCGKKGFVYNKDADTYQCPSGELAMRKNIKTIRQRKYLRYFFSIKKCKICPNREGCYNPNTKKQTITIRIDTSECSEQKAFQESDYFRQRSKQRYKIEAKNAELKHAHGLNTTDSHGLFAMKLQSYFTAFTANIKRIIKLQDKVMA